MDVQAAAQLPESFSHAPDSNTWGARRGHLKLLFCRYAPASILNFYANVTVRDDNANPGRGAFRMTMNIRETLLYGPENRRFRLAIEPLKIRGNLQIHLNLATLSESFYVPAQSRSKSRFIQQRWME